jgi:hypothetical protein
MTSVSRTLTIDFEDVEVGDPAFDGVYVHQAIRLINCNNLNESQLLADRFVDIYLKKNQNEDISKRLEFYKLTGILYQALFDSINVMNPNWQSHKNTSMLLFPLTRIPLVAKYVFGIEGYPFLLKYFQQFVKSNN